MAVPKKRTGKAAQAKRRANWKGSVPETTICKNCGAVVLTHTVCTECGQYKGKVVSIKGQKDETKPVKKSVKTETPVETVEETKTEDKSEEN